MEIDNVSSHGVEVYKKHGRINKVIVRLTLEDEKDNHKFEFSGISEQDRAVSLEQHHVARDYKEDVSGAFDSIDYELKIDDEALDSINQAREAANKLLQENGLEWEVGGKQ